MFHPHFIQTAATEKIQQLTREAATRSSIEQSGAASAVAGHRPYHQIYTLMLGAI